MSSFVTNCIIEQGLGYPVLRTVAMSNGQTRYAGTESLREQSLRILATWVKDLLFVG